MIKSGWIGFIRGDDFWESAAQLAKMGYQAMDSDASFVPGEGSLADKVKRLRDMGVEPLTVSAGFDPEGLKNGLPELIEKCKAQNIMRVTMWGSSAISSFRKGYGNNGTYDELMKDIEAINYVVPRLADEGIVFTYHNHYQEFTVWHKNVPTIFHMLVNCDERMKFDLDAGWVTVSGNDPVEIMQKFEGRIHVVHLKDIYDFEACKRMSGNTASLDDKGFCALGSGLLNVEGVAAEMARQGIPYGIVEQDRLRYLDTMQALTMARLSMIETGYFE
jgi:sugar phosphate isomerase/epimerase